MGMPDTQSEQRYTYGDYLKWPDDERWELIEGRPYAMTPGPTDDHQEISVFLTTILAQYFKGKPCRVFHAPFDVRLPEKDEKDEQIETVVQPDLLVLCEPKKADKRGVRGAPDLAVEILSESTAARDLSDKLLLYEKHGVRCYIIVDPWAKTLTVRYLEPIGKFGPPELYSGYSKIQVRIFAGLIIDLADVFPVRE